MFLFPGPSKISLMITRNHQEPEATALGPETRGSSRRTGPPPVHRQGPPRRWAASGHSTHWTHLTAAGVVSPWLDGVTALYIDCTGAAGEAYAGDISNDIAAIDRQYM